MNGQVTQQDRLYALLPGVYRERDAAEGYPLRALLRLVQEQSDLLQSDVRQLWDDLFIETCRRWVIPYIGDLVGNDALHDAEGVGEAATAQGLFPDLIGPDLLPPLAVRLRADVAKTLYYRRRKGTLPMLEELVRDVTGWPVRAVEFFRLLEWSQNLNHLRPQAHDCVDLRRGESLDRVGGPFDSVSHTVDVRPIGQHRGWHNIANIGFFIWRLRSYALRKVPARRAGESWQYHFSPLGNPTPLFNPWRREGDESGLATEWHLPGPIRPWAFYEQPDDYWNSALAIMVDGTPIQAGEVACTDLSTWKRPPGKTVAIDVRLGRIAVGDGFALPGAVDVDCHYGFGADLGGGTYPRRKWLVRPDVSQTRLYVKADGQAFAGADPLYTSVDAALTAWQGLAAVDAVICILDSRSYGLPESLDLGNDRRLVIEAADGQRPFLQTHADGLRVLAQWSGESRLRTTELTLSGVVIEGHLDVVGDLARLRLLHSTLMPGRRLLAADGGPETDLPSLQVASESSGEPINRQLQVQVAYCITGPLRLPEQIAGLWLLDSIVDGLGQAAISGGNALPGPITTLERATVLGESRYLQLSLASTVVFTDRVWTARQQEGCVRFSLVPSGSKTPRRYRCQPDLEIGRRSEEAEALAEATGAQLGTAEKETIALDVAARLLPIFQSSRYGDPGYAQFGPSCPAPIASGAEDGSEMGAFNHLKQSQRETNLTTRLNEYLPFGLEAGIIYVN